MTWINFESDDFRNIRAAISTFVSGLLRKTESPTSNFTEIIDTKYGGNPQTIISKTNDSQCLKLGPLPYRPGDTSRQVEIYLQYGLKIKAKDTDSERRYEIVKSSTEMVYLKVTSEDGDETRERVQGLHFDFELNSEGSRDAEGRTEANHPVFHAQYNPNCVDTAAIERWNPDPHEVDYPDYPRIPCAPFDVVSVGYMILNDHLPTQIEANEGWPSELLHEHLPRFPTEAFDLDPQGGKPMVPEWWYIPNSVDRDGKPLLDPRSYRPI